MSFAHCVVSGACTSAGRRLSGGFSPTSRRIARCTPGRDTPEGLPPVARLVDLNSHVCESLPADEEAVPRPRPAVSNGGKREHARQQTRVTSRCNASHSATPETPRKPTHVNYLSFSPSRLKDYSPRISRHVTSAFSSHLSSYQAVF